MCNKLYSAYYCFNCLENLFFLCNSDCDECVGQGRGHHFRSDRNRLKSVLTFIEWFVILSYSIVSLLSSQITEKQPQYPATDSNSWKWSKSYAVKIQSLSSISTYAPSWFTWDFMQSYLGQRTKARLQCGCHIRSPVLVIDDVIILRLSPRLLPCYYGVSTADTVADSLHPQASQQKMIFRFHKDDKNSNSKWLLHLFLVSGLLLLLCNRILI